MAEAGSAAMYAALNFRPGSSRHTPFDHLNVHQRDLVLEVMFEADERLEQAERKGRPRATKKSSPAKRNSSPKPQPPEPEEPQPSRQFRGVTEQWWRAIGEDPQVTGMCLGVALMISTEARRDTGTRAMISIDRIAEAFDIGERSVKRYTRQLQDVGYLKKAQRGHRRGDGQGMANVYELCFPGQSKTSTVHPDER
jgi:hypothetical protein